jgi:hypothetical protein
LDILWIFKDISNFDKNIGKSLKLFLEIAFAVEFLVAHCYIGSFGVPSQGISIALES